MIFKYTIVGENMTIFRVKKTLNVKEFARNKA